MNFNLTPLEAKQSHYENIAREVLGGHYLFLKIKDNFVIREDFNHDQTQIECIIVMSDTNRTQEKKIRKKFLVKLCVGNVFLSCVLSALTVLEVYRPIRKSSRRRGRTIPQE